MKKLVLVSIIFYCLPVHSQYTISGFVVDSLTSERIIGANIIVGNSNIGVASNNYGFYSLSINGKDTLNLFVTYIGYKTKKINIFIEKNVELNFFLLSGIDLDEVIIKANNTEKIINTPVISSLEIPMKQISMIPSIGGEKDIMRVYQLMPGIQSGKEGTSGLYVRGGSPDQNLILLDDIPLYYVNHIGGFISVFNPNAINSAKIIKGAFPAHYGGRLSSVMDVRMKEGDLNKFGGNFTFGLISSKLTLEGPVFKGKTSYIVSIRRSLFDLFTRAYENINSDGEFSAGYTLFDLNTKINHQFSNKDRLYLSIYSGKDRIFIKQRDNGSQDDNPYKYKSINNIQWGNRVFSARWNHVYGSKLFSNLTTGFTKFYYTTESTGSKIEKASDNEVGEISSLFHSNINDWLLKMDYDYFYSIRHHIKFGYNLTSHKFNPTANSYFRYDKGETPTDTSFKSNQIKAFESSIYLEDIYQFSKKLSFNAGMRFTNFLVKNNPYYSFEPRLVGNLKILKDFSIKAGYSSMQQFIHLLSNSGAGIPTDLWVPVTGKVPPQKSNQLVIGLIKLFPAKSTIELSIEAFYKTMNNLIEFQEGASFFSSHEDWQDRVELNGTAVVKGIEFLIQKKEGKLTGWMGYTLSKNTRQFDNLNFGNPFPYKFDRRHEYSIVINHQFNDNFLITLTWVYTSGNAISLPLSKYDLYTLDLNKDYNVAYFYDEAQIYGERNNYRVPPYHRLDLSFYFTKKLFKGTRAWSIDIYNAYCRQNPYYLYFDYDKSGNRKLYLFSLFPVIPSFSYSYTF